MRNTLALAAAAALVFLGGVAHADVYTLSINHCSSPGCTVPTGKVFVTQNGANTLHFDVELTGLDYFNEAGAAFDSVEFSLSDNKAVISHISNSLFIADSSHSVNGDGFGSFNYGVDYNGKNGNFKGGLIQSLSFDVTETGLTPGSLLDEKGAKIAVDVASTNLDHHVIATGLVGATLVRGVPEPATWAMLIMGVAMIGAAARRRRAVTPLAA